MFKHAANKRQETLSAEAQAAANRQLLNRLYQNIPSSIISTLFVSAMLLFIIWSEVEHERIMIWVVCLGIATSIKAIVYLFYRKQEFTRLDTDSWQRHFILHDIFSALAWGLAGVLLYSTDSITHQTFLILALGGVAAGGIPLRSPNLRALIFFIILTTTPLCIRLLMDGDSIHTAMGAMLFMYVALSLKVTLQYHHTIKSALELRFENEHLIKHLTDSKNQAEHINQELSAEIRNHKSTAKKLIEARDNAELAARSKSEFLATMSHEIRTPMNGVLGMAELLLDSGVTGKQLRFTETILHSGQTLLNLINEILDFSRLEAGKMELQAEYFDLQELVENTGDQFAVRAQNKGLELICQYPVGAHHTFEGDKDKINQILNNLVGNAIKFTQQGEVKTQVQVLERDEHISTVRLEVLDTGIGISDEVQDKIFESFSQADGSTTRNYGGTGLGLAICKKLCELMQGRIGVENLADTGSLFWVELDLKRAAPLKPRAQLSDQHNLNGARVLIVDTSQTNSKVLEQQIKDWRGHCRCVSTPKQALQQLITSSSSDTPYDLAIIDKNMVGMDGIQLAQRIRQSPEIKDLSLVMLSSVSNLTDTGGWMMAGIDGYLSKPVRQDEFYSTLTRVLDIEDDPTPTIDNLKPETQKACLEGHILIAEDNPVNSELAAHLLDMLGCTYCIVETGQEALDALYNCPLDNLQNPYDLILMDCQMPGVDGYQATRQIRQHEQQAGDNRHIPVIALTANSMAGDREKCLAAGMDDYLSKPFKVEQLSEILEKWLPLIKEATASELHAAPVQNKLEDDIDDFAHIDQETLLKVKSLQREGTPNILHKLIRLYLENSPAMISKIETALSNGDAEQLKAAAHSLKSCSLSLGALQLGELCREMETAGSANSLDNLISRLHIIQFEYEQVCKALQAELGAEAA